MVWKIAQKLRFILPAVKINTSCDFRKIKLIFFKNVNRVEWISSGLQVYMQSCLCTSVFPMFFPGSFKIAASVLSQMN